ncbi:MAG TPA: hypothetical protein VJL61_01975 [Rhodanobacteraceae bacterium]|nr:hypothetical protein [Rhodanobacteraceae bacterium]
MKIFWFMLAFVPVACLAGKATDCAKVDTSLIECPVPRAPQVTELQGAKIVVELKVQLSGSVSSARIISLVGDPRWRQPVLQAVAHWRYKPQSRAVSKVVPFNLGLSGGTPPNSSVNRTLTPLRGTRAGYLKR